jgi:predicted Zn-dependent protease
LSFFCSPPPQDIDNLGLPLRQGALQRRFTLGIFAFHICTVTQQEFDHVPVSNDVMAKSVAETGISVKNTANQRFCNRRGTPRPAQNRWWGVPVAENRHTSFWATKRQLLGGAGLARYSRDQEREADAVGMDYLVAAGYDPHGMVGLMSLLTQLGGRDPLFMERLFSSHPMSADRLETARKRAQTYPPGERALHEARFLERTAAVRAITPAIRLFNKAEQARTRGDFAAGVRLAREGLALAPQDYAGLLILAACQNSLNQPGAALATARLAATANPRDPNARGMIAVTALALGRYDEALEATTAFERALPSDPQARFLRGFCHERLGNTAAAATAYRSYLQAVGASGADARSQHARNRLAAWAPSHP